MTPFLPVAAATVNIDVTAASAAVAVVSAANAPRQIRVMNDGTATAWVNFGASTVTAALATGMPVAAGAIEVLTIHPQGGVIYAAAIAAGSTGKIYFTPGSGF